MNPILKAHCETGCFGHGYLLVGNREKLKIWARKAASVLLAKEEVFLDSHPDFFEQDFDLFGISESRDLKRKSSMSPLAAAKKVFVVEISSFTIEAANALLKLMEEPPQTCHFFIIVPFLENIIPALRSRLLIIVDKDVFQLDEQKKNFYRDFLKSEPDKRLSLVKEIADDKKAAADFLDGLEAVLAENFKVGNKPSSFSASLAFSFEEIKSNRQFLFDRGASAKMILEHFALILPRLP